MSAIILLLLLGLLLGLVIGLVVKFFGVQRDEREEAVEALLPGANCGGCGAAGCTAFARALVAAAATPDQCPASTPENLRRVAALLGVEVVERAPVVAVVRCGGDARRTRGGPGYNGINDCRSAVLVYGGAKGCRHGCLGLATCARACPFGAIEISAAELAVVHPELCTGCGCCIAVCPRDLIRLAPASAPLHVFCNSPAKGRDKSQVCKAACIGCRKCVKDAAEGQMLIDGFLASVNYEDPPAAELAEVCPTQCLLPARQRERTRPEAKKDAEVVNA